LKDGLQGWGIDVLGTLQADLFQQLLGIILELSQPIV